MKKTAIASTLLFVCLLLWSPEAEAALIQHYSGSGTNSFTNDSIILELDLVFGCADSASCAGDITLSGSIDSGDGNGALSLSTSDFRAVGHVDECPDIEAVYGEASPSWREPPEEPSFKVTGPLYRAFVFVGPE